MNLCVDIGNSFTKCALFDSSGTLLDKKLVESADVGELSKVVATMDFDKIIFCSVKNHDVSLLRAKIKAEVFFICLNENTKVPIFNNYGTKNTLGKDRLAVVVGGAEMFPGKNILVIDAGTCITYDFLDKNNLYHGGSISPGVQMRLNSMHHFTDKLPLLEFNKPLNLIGNNTKDSMLSGVAYGILHEIEGFIEAYKIQFDDLKVLITGGDAYYFESMIKNEIFVLPDLMLEGLNRILEYNAQEFDDK